MACRAGFPSRGGCGRSGRGGRRMFTAPNFGGFGFGRPGGSPTQCPFANGSGLDAQLSPEIAIAGLRDLLTHAAPYLEGIVSSIDEQMIEQAIQASVAKPGTGGAHQNRTGQHFKETVSVDKSGEKDMYRVDIVLGVDAKAESLKIKRKDNVVTIDVKIETLADTEDRSSCLYQEYTRRIILPENVDLTQLESVLSPEGVLTVKAPFSRKSEPDKAPQSVAVLIPIIVEEHVTE